MDWSFAKPDVQIFAGVWPEIFVGHLDLKDRKFWLTFESIWPEDPSYFECCLGHFKRLITYFTPINPKCSVLKSYRAHPPALCRNAANMLTWVSNQPAAMPPTCLHGYIKSACWYMNVPYKIWCIHTLWMVDFATIFPNLKKKNYEKSDVICSKYGLKWADWCKILFLLKNGIL